MCHRIEIFIVSSKRTVQGGNLRRFTSVLALFCLCAGHIVAFAQPFEFGSLDDPLEMYDVPWWQRRLEVQASAGVGLYGPAWYAESRTTLTVPGRSVALRARAMVRGNTLEAYSPSVQTPYEALQQLQFLRYTPSQTGSVYARIGPQNNLHLGHAAHLVHFFGSAVAYDERTVGVEAAWKSRVMQVYALSDDVRFNGVVAGSVGLSPLYFLRRNSALKRTVIQATHVRDGVDSPTGLQGYAVEVSTTLHDNPFLRVIPYVSFAWYEGNRGGLQGRSQGLSVGGMVSSPNFLDIARGRIRFALHYNGAGFVPGFFGPFYPVHNPEARFLDSRAFLEQDSLKRSAGIPISSALGGNGATTELRFVAFRRLHLWAHLYRHYGSQPLTQWNVRLGYHEPGSLRFNLGVDRGGLRSFSTLFGPMNDQSALVWEVEYAWRRNWVIGMETRYTYEQVARDERTTYYLTQRRFSPYLGLRLHF